MPSFKKNLPDNNHKENPIENHKKKTSGSKTGSRKTDRTVPSSADNKRRPGPSFYIPVLSAALTILLFLAGGSFVLSRNRSAFESPAQEPAVYNSEQDPSVHSASPNNTPAGSASAESLRSWLGVDTVLEILSPEPAEAPQPSESQALSSAEDSSSAVPALSASPADEAPVSSFSFVSSAAPTRTDPSAAAAGTRMEMAAADENIGQTATGKNNAAAADSTAEAASEKATPDKDSAKAGIKSEANKQSKADTTAETGEKKTDTKKSSSKNDTENDKENKENKGNKEDKGGKDSGNKDQNTSNKNSKNDKGDSDSEVSLTKKQKEYVRNWEELHGRDFPMETTLHDYNWDYLEYDEMWNLYYKGDKKYKIRRGIDVSEFQGEIDWDEVKKAGYDFVFVRAGHRMFESGDLQTDSRAVKNMKRAKKAGLDVGVYVFSQAVSESEAREEAQLCLDVIKKSGVEITLPVVFDPEIQTEYIARINYISGEQFTDNAVAFCKKIEKAGFTPAIYTNCSTETDILDMSRLNNAVIWYADYGIIPESPYRFTFWQYSNTGWVEGIPEGMTDLNVWFVEREKE